MRILGIDPGTRESAVVIRVHDIPRPGGSKRGFYNKKSGRVIITEDCRRSKTWREAVRQSAVKVVGELPVLTGPLVVEMMFYLSRPKSHYGTGRNHRKVKPSAPRYHTKKPDLTKIIRSTEDALTGIVWRDDSQIVARDSGKLYADHQPPGVRIVIRSVEQQGG